MNLDPRGPEVLTMMAQAQMASIVTVSGPNRIQYCVGGLRQRGQTALANQVIGAVEREGDAYFRHLVALGIAVRWSGNYTLAVSPTPMLPDPWTPWPSTGYYAPGLNLFINSNRNPNVDTAPRQGAKLTMTGNGPDGLRGTPDDWYTPVWTSGYAQTQNYFSNRYNRWVYYRAGVRAMEISHLDASLRCVGGMLDCQAIAANPAAINAVLDVQLKGIEFADALDALAPAVNAVQAYTLPPTPPPHIDTYYGPGFWQLNP